MSALTLDGVVLNGLAIDWYVKRDGNLFCPVCSTERGNETARPANFNLALDQECECCGLTVGESEGLVELRSQEELNARFGLKESA